MSQTRFNSAMSKSRTPTNQNALGVLQVGRDKFAVGLKWSNVGQRNSVSPAQARKAAKAASQQFFLIKKPRTYALGTTALGHKKGMPSLALALIENTELVGVNCVGVFPIPNSSSYYFIGIKDGFVDPGTDRILENGHEAEEELREYVDSTNVDTIYAPSDWDIENATNAEGALEKLILRKGKRYHLVPASRRREMILGVMGAVILCVAYGAYYEYQQFQAYEKQKQLLAQEAAERAAKKRLREQEKIVFPPPTWTDAVYGMALIDRCINMINVVPLYPAGWAMNDIICTPQQVTEELGRNDGTTNWVAPGVNKSPLGKPAINLNSPDSISIVWQMNVSDLPKWTGKEVGDDPGDVRPYFISQFGEIFQAFSLSPAIHPQVTATKGGQPLVTNAPWMSSTLQFDSTYNVKEFEKILDRIPTFTVDSVTYSPGGSWHVSGTIYYNPAPSPTKPGAGLPPQPQNGQ